MSLLTQRELAARWRLSTKTLDRWRKGVSGPAYLKLHGRVLYRLEDVEDYEAGHLHRSPGQRVHTEDEA